MDKPCFSNKPSAPLPTRDRSIPFGMSDMESIVTRSRLERMEATGRAPTAKEVHYVYNFRHNPTFWGFYYLHKKVSTDQTWEKLGNKNSPLSQSSECDRSLLNA
uniref:Uncharacterized protein n=1 Tax=Cannabis sativa TaxID=3483 RepID=A0A803Q647_CANSA